MFIAHRHYTASRTRIEWGKDGHQQVEACPSPSPSQEPRPFKAGLETWEDLYSSVPACSKYWAEVLLACLRHPRSAPLPRTWDRDRSPTFK